MISNSIYLDHNATTQPDSEVVAAMMRVLTEHWGNPSSLHRVGQYAKQELELARESVCKLINCNTSDLVFTSGGTESLNLALGGIFGSRNNRDVVITTQVEHSAILETCDYLEKGKGLTVIRLPVDDDGVVGVADLQENLCKYQDRVGLVTIQWVNNETGVIQPIFELLQSVRDTGDNRILFHTDATQWVGKEVTDVQAAGFDLLTFSAHKLHGPKGIGALYIRPGVRLQPVNIGGSQERKRRGGTENVPGIVGFGVAGKLAYERINLDDNLTSRRMSDLRDHFESRIVDEIKGSSVNGLNARYGRLWTTSNIAFRRLESEAILLLLSEMGVCASGGSACSSGSLEASHVLRAMNLEEEKAHGSVRFSFCYNTTIEELDTAVEKIKIVIEKLNKSLPPAG